MFSAPNRGIFSSAVAAALEQDGGESVYPLYNKGKESDSIGMSRQSLLSHMGGEIRRRTKEFQTPRVSPRQVILEGDGEGGRGGRGPMRRRGQTGRRDGAAARETPYGDTRQFGMRTVGVDGQWRHDLFESEGALGEARRQSLDGHVEEPCSGIRGEWTHDFFDGDISSCPGSTVFVRGLPGGVGEADLRSKLESCGTIVAIKLDSGRLPTALISFLERGAAGRAVKTLHGSRMRGRGPSGAVVEHVLKVAEVEKARQPESAPVVEEADDTSFMYSVAARSGSRSKESGKRRRTPP
ncbi:rna recognition motif protein [Cystoisospora suis]|uniref:Rna recognition motif protein n=1 Tax=Cystoisospora suis TaxID=483139 RepID=A0A2C6KZP9_9APIC|nr:rna recognition motif protein [Cystoisospora suis]